MGRGRAQDAVTTIGRPHSMAFRAGCTLRHVMMWSFSKIVNALPCLTVMRFFGGTLNFREVPADTFTVVPSMSVTSTSSEPAVTS